MFYEIGRLPNKFKIKLKGVAERVTYVARKVPVALKERLRKELQTLIDQGIIREVEEPTEWFDSLIILEYKTGALRLCIDPKDLCKWIKREHFILPTKSAITRAIAGAVCIVGLLPD